MAQPSSTHRERSSSHHHHRTISSTTLLLVLSLILAVLSVMLSIPRSASTATAADSTPSGILSMFSPKRNSEVIAREASVAEREAEVAKREADIINGSPAGVTIGTCLPCVQTSTFYAMPTEPVTVIKEVVKEVETLSPPWWKDVNLRAEDLLDREARVTEREKEVGRREEVVGKRESDASRRETWIMEHLIQDAPIPHTEEYVTYEDVPRRPSKELPARPPPQSIVTETETATKTILMPAPANTRLAAQPSPEITSTQSDYGAPTTVVEFVVEESEPPRSTVTVIRERAPSREREHHWW